MSDIPLYSWDSTVFIAWISEEPGAPLKDIESVVVEIDNKKANLVVSVLAYSEILEVKHTPEQMIKFREFLKRSNVVVADNTVAIAEKAGEIRSRGFAEKGKKKRKIKTPDATFLATTIIYKAAVLHSLDPDLLHLNQSPMVEGLRITKPIPLGP